MEVMVSEGFETIEDMLNRCGGKATLFCEDCAE